MSLPTHYLSLLFLLLVTLLVLVGVGLALRITDIECLADQSPCSASAISQLHTYQQRRLLFLPDLTSNQTASITSEYRIEKYFLKLPSTLVVELKPQLPAYNLVSNQAQILSVNTDGQVMGHDLISKSPTIYVSDSLWPTLTQNQNLPGQFHTLMMSTLTALSQLNTQPVSIDLADWQTMAIELPNQPLVILDPTQAKIDVARLKIVLAELPHLDNNQAIKEIDVRYKLPVLRKAVTIPRHVTQ